MAKKIDVRSLVIGFLIGLFALMVLGATSEKDRGAYQLSIASSGQTDTGGHYVIYGRIHTGTGKIELV